MKFHYQYVSQNTVRIELIPEDKKETALIEKLLDTDESDEQLLLFFQKGLEAYSSGSLLVKNTFMNFPKVALCSYTKHAQAEEQVA